jgi:hypothetical protein
MIIKDETELELSNETAEVTVGLATAGCSAVAAPVDSLGRRAAVDWQP